MSELEKATPHTLNSSEMMDLAKNLWPINRSITGPGFNESLSILEKYIKIKFNRLKFKSGEKVFDWEIPKVWNIRNAYIEDSTGKKFCEFRANNLHVMGYSIPVDKTLTLNELQKNLHSLPDQVDAVPYVTSYYEENWGFCISQKERESLVDGNYHVRIESELTQGELVVGELLFPGQTKQEIFISTYLCHPSMANNELSGPVVTAELVKFISSLEKRTYSYRVVFIPETIGSIAYLSRNLPQLQKHVVAGFNVTCVGDDRTYSYLPSRNGSTLSDRVAKHVLRQIYPNYKSYSWLDRGSDERQYCAPGVDLPVASIMRSKYGEYPEYHTSLDKLGSVVTEKGLEGGFQALTKAILILESNKTYCTCTLGEPRLGKLNLYPQTSIKGGYPARTKLISNVITYSDGKRDCLEIAELLNINALEVAAISEELVTLGVLYILGD